jgi:hypothetical protein
MVDPVALYRRTHERKDFPWLSAIRRYENRGGAMV